MAMGHRALVTGTGSFALSLTTGNNTCTVDSHNTVAFCAGKITVNGDDLVAAIFGRRELAERTAADLEVAKQGHVAALAELRDDLKSRKATIEALLARVSDADVAALRAERDRLLLLLLQQQQLGSR